MSAILKASAVTILTTNRSQPKKALFSKTCWQRGRNTLITTACRNSLLVFFFFFSPIVFDSAILNAFLPRRQYYALQKLSKLSLFFNTISKISIFQFVEYDLFLWNLGNTVLSQWTPRIACTITQTIPWTFLVQAYSWSLRFTYT